MDPSSYMYIVIKMPMKFKSRYKMFKDRYKIKLYNDFAMKYFVL